MAPPEAQTLPLEAAALKACCASAYEHEWARALLGDSLHPGGLALTERLGELLALPAGATLLDVACGRGASAIHLAQRFGWRVIGLDLGEANLRAARAAAEDAAVSHLVTFVRGDAEGLPLVAAAVDGVICECALCTMPSKQSALAEFARVVCPGGAAGVADLTRDGDVPDELSTLLAWVACVADARPLDDYAALLTDAGFAIRAIERHDRALGDLVGGVRKRLIGVEVLSRLGQLPVPTEDVATAKRLAKSAEQAVRAGTLGYGIVTAVAPPRP
jgi:SAM-dependent methyltransferase